MRGRTLLGVAATLLLATVFVYLRHSSRLPQTWAVTSTGLLAELGTPLPRFNVTADASPAPPGEAGPWRPPSWASKLLPDPDEEAKEPLAPLPVGRQPNVLVVTLASGNYRQFGVELMESAVKHFCKECNLTLLIMTDDTDGLPSLDGRLIAGQVPWRPWPRSTISKCTDLLPYDDLIRRQDFAIFLDADLVFVGDVTLDEVWGDYVAVEHPYYPRNDRGWCGKWGGDWESTQPNGFDKNGRFTFCQYPYEFSPRSKAHIPLGYGKKGPTWDSGNSYYLQGALFGGTGIRFSQLCATMAANVAEDDKNGKGPAQLASACVRRQSGRSTHR